jgi:hypothetical protein
MLEALWEAAGDDEAALVPSLHRYFVACCRRIWRLLPQEGSRRGIEVAERYLAGEATDDELDEVDWHCEGAAFNINYNCEPEAIQRWVAEVRAIPADEMAAMLSPPGAAPGVDEQELLMRAAYFADYATIYPHLTPKRGVPDSYAAFLSAELLREQFGGPSLEST